MVALVADLMDRSRISAALGEAALGEVEFARDVERAVGADVVIVDLARDPAAVGRVREVAPAVRIVAFGPHVDDAGLAAARAAGADSVLPRSRFFADPATAVAGVPES